LIIYASKWTPTKNLTIWSVRNEELLANYFTKWTISVANFDKSINQTKYLSPKLDTNALKEKMNLFAKGFGRSKSQDSNSNDTTSDEAKQAELQSNA
jgi:hypothetical protein